MHSNTSPLVALFFFQLLRAYCDPSIALHDADFFFFFCFGDLLLVDRLLFPRLFGFLSFVSLTSVAPVVDFTSLFPLLLASFTIPPPSTFTSCCGFSIATFSTISFPSIAPSFSISFATCPTVSLRCSLGIAFAFGFDVASGTGVPSTLAGTTWGCLRGGGSTKTPCFFLFFCAGMLSSGHSPCQLGQLHLPCQSSCSAAYHQPSW